MFLKSIYINNVKCFSDIALSFEDENGDIRKRTLLLHQLVMSPAFGLDTDESKEIEDMKNRYRYLRDKTNLSAKEQAELDKLTTVITQLPLGGRASMILSEEHEQLLRKIESEFNVVLCSNGAICL